MPNEILPHQLPTALAGRSGIRMLSLDCFDTLLWRDTHAPRDLFGALASVTMPQRIWAEERARAAALLARRRNEVSIAEIYREALPHAGADAHAAAIREELDAEAAHCFAFMPTVELMRDAQARGIETIIVSDTYLDADQLRTLIAEAAGDEVAGLIGRIFCSSAFGRSKAEGLYELVLKELEVPANAILHIGDNRNADVVGVARFGVQTLHLKQFAASTEQRLRLEASVNAILHPEAPLTAITHQPHRAALSAVEPQIDDPAEALGFATLGTVFNAFEAWLREEAAKLRNRFGGTVHWLFLMRDGHLPRLVHAARSGTETAAHAIEISRFTALASSFVDAAAVERYLQLEIGGDLTALAKQLLLPPAEITLLVKQAAAKGGARAFLDAIREPARMRRIVKNSAAFRERMLAHVRKLVAPARGDTLMLVDLGYNGTVQNEIDALLARGLGVNVAGRYLILREQYRTGLDKSGFLGSDHYDAMTLEALCANVAVVEQLSTAAQGSVVDYAPDGTAIRRGNSIKARQSDIRSRVQQGCLRFVTSAQGVTARRDMPDAVAMWRRGAAAALARLMYLPMADELSVIQQFEHDVNLGTDETVALFDPEIARRGLRQRGLFYMKGSERMYLPAELQGEGLAIKLSLLAHRRFGLALKYADFIDKTIALPVIIADGNDVTTGSVTATPTHDGYYLAPVPVGDCRFSVGLQFGKLYEWLQIDSAVFMPVERFLSDKQRPGLDETEALPSLEGMEQTAPHLFHCEDDAAFMMVPPPPRRSEAPMMLAIVFRPIAERPPAMAIAPDAKALAGRA